MNAKKWFFTLSLALSAGAQNTQIPIGMNIQGLNYYTPAMPFVDIMKSSSGNFIPYDVSGGNTAWDVGFRDSIPVDSNDYPLFLPVSVQGMQLGIRIMVNNYYKGDYAFLYEGKGTFSFNTKGKRKEGDLQILSFDGLGGHTWFQITSSDVTDPVRNIRIIPLEYVGKESEMPLFESLYLKGLEPFHAIRFMDYLGTNGSWEKEWTKRTRPASRTQAGSGSLEYAIALSNQLQEDLWVCVPHAADDEYIRKMAEMIKDQLDANLKVYVEYSNEIWNWQFAQAHYVGKNGVDDSNPFLNAHDTVRTQLENVGIKYCNDASSYCHPEKDAYMMARTFKHFKSVFGNDSRLKTVAAVQHAWADNTKRILNYLFKDDGVGADIVSPGGYFGFNNADHDTWVAMSPESVTAEMILKSAEDHFADHTEQWTLDQAAFAESFGVEYAVYEGGQHMQPYNQGEWDYNHAVFDAQIDAGMFKLYERNLQLHHKVKTSIFMAFSYVGERKSRWGSWGHLENLEQLSSGNLKQIAPKYQALLDYNTPKESITGLNESIENRDLEPIELSNFEIENLIKQGTQFFLSDGNRAEPKGNGVYFMKLQSGDRANFQKVLIRD